MGKKILNVIFQFEIEKKEEITKLNSIIKFKLYYNIMDDNILRNNEEF